MNDTASTPVRDAHDSRLVTLTLAALGVVYGDIGTSPLYALKEVFGGTHHPVPIDEANVLGILSVVFWALMLVVSVKYIVFIMRANNRGEGGIMALMALVRRGEKDARRARVLMIMGLFGVAEVFENLEEENQQVIETTLSSLMPSREDLRASRWSIARGTIVGFLLGLVPGMTGTASSVLAYVAERKSSKYPEKFGTGVIEGVAGPETANNAHANAALIPLFTMGIPASPSVAVLMGAFMMNGLIPGPLLFKEHASVAWGVIASLYIGNVILLILNLPLIPLWVKFLKIPYKILMTIVLAVMIVGAYTVSNTVFDVFVMLLFGAIGYVLRKLDFPLAPIVLTLIMGPPMEKSLRQSLEMSQGDFSILVASPIAATLLAISGIILLSPILKYAWKRWIPQPRAQGV